MNKKLLFERVGLFLSFVGLGLIFQPFYHELLYYGFIVLGIGGFIYVYSTYLSIDKEGDASTKTLVKWFFILVGTVVFFVILSINLAPLLVG